MRHGLLALDLLNALRHDDLQQLASLFTGKPQLFCLSADPSEIFSLSQVKKDCIHSKSGFSTGYKGLCSFTLGIKSI